MSGSSAQGKDEQCSLSKRYRKVRRNFSIIARTSSAVWEAELWTRGLTQNIYCNLWQICRGLIEQLSH